ncbi:ATP-binding cassette domain-containing protein [Trueperella pecoris]|uniref:ATP-binding cassette domain-containing protein n=1 Tax=Trueperella pecoris TaxID=2733571 RepID=A0A7M1QUZ6_9ACTO|nr:ATP-binding cassette domain-containing protein [Trueperella pecoris]QOR45334.1 ATP-binding cassette domain-containing protein [Trueperella pecoris]
MRDTKANDEVHSIPRQHSVQLPPLRRKTPNRCTRDLSGGERQRTALVRALSTEPALLIGDDPTGSLDTYTRDAAADLLFSTSKERNAALLVVTHDLTVAERADMILNLAEYQPNQYAPRRAPRRIGS